ncbi:MAG: hypothetical protein Q9171_005338 [Xanthocarpia ochracea]
MPDFVTLKEFLVEYPSAIELYKQQYKTILLAVLNHNFKSSQIRSLVARILVVRHNTPLTYLWYDRTGDQDINFFHHTYKPDINRALCRMKDPVAGLIGIASTCQDLDYFEKMFLDSCSQHCRLEPVRGEGGEELSSTEAHRIRRGLWRFQLLCESTHPESRTRPDDDSERAMGKFVFLTSLTDWEKAEMECMYLHLCCQYRILKQTQKGLCVQDQRPIIQRLLSIAGFGLQEPSPDRLESCREGENPLYTHNYFADAFPKLWMGFLSLRDESTRAYCDIESAAMPNQGWNGIRKYLLRTGRTLSPRQAYSLWRCGCCIWDVERLDEFIQRLDAIHD